MTNSRDQARATTNRLSVLLMLSVTLSCTARRSPAVSEKASPIQVPTINGSGDRATTIVRTNSTNSTGVRSVCNGVAAALEVGALTVEWQSDQAARGLGLGRDGNVTRDKELVARVVGGCILGVQGRVLRSVDERGVVTDGRGRRIGLFQRRVQLRDQSGEVVHVDEVFLSSDGSATAVTNDGVVYRAPSGGPAYSLPASVDGSVARGRRAALLLLGLGPDLESQPD